MPKNKGGGGKSKGSKPSSESQGAEGGSKAKSSKGGTAVKVCFPGITHLSPTLVPYIFRVLGVVQYPPRPQRVTRSWLFTFFLSGKPGFNLQQ